MMPRIQSGAERPDGSIKPLVDAIQVLIDRGSAPSHDVQLAAAGLLGRPIGPGRLAIVYGIPSEDGEREHDVKLYCIPVHDEAQYGHADVVIVAAACDCAYHGHVGRPDPDRICKHILTAFALAVRAGHRRDF